MEIRVRCEVSWGWLRILSSVRHWYSGFESSGSTRRVKHDKVILSPANQWGGWDPLKTDCEKVVNGRGQRKTKYFGENVTLSCMHYLKIESRLRRCLVISLRRKWNDTILFLVILCEIRDDVFSERRSSLEKCGSLFVHLLAFFWTSRSRHVVLTSLMLLLCCTLRVARHGTESVNSVNTCTSTAKLWEMHTNYLTKTWRKGLLGGLRYTWKANIRLQ